jgi:hypothetical protein
MTTIARKSVKKNLWACPKCGRQFARQRQAHSCKPFLLEQHFEGKPVGELLYKKFKQAVRKKIGPFRVESLECCIHFVNATIFAAVKLFKDKIQLDFVLNHQIKNMSKRIHKYVPISANRHVYYIDIRKKKDIDNEVLDWIQEAHDRENNLR